MKHTPTPWKVIEKEGMWDDKLDIMTANNITRIASLSQTNNDIANAQFIVKAVNQHDELVSAVSQALSFIMDLDTSPQDDDIIDELDTVLAKIND